MHGSKKTLERAQEREKAGAEVPSALEKRTKEESIGALVAADSIVTPFLAVAHLVISPSITSRAV